MPQSGTGVSVEAIDPAFQTSMLEMLRQVNRTQVVVGWYHSHPGFGCWLSSVDINTQQSFEQLDKRAIAFVIDPIQSVKGKVVMDCFRLIDQQTLVTGQSARQIVSNPSFMNKPSMQAIMHNLNRHYYSLLIGTYKSHLDKNMLLSLRKRNWGITLRPLDWDKQEKQNSNILEKLLALTNEYSTRLDEEDKSPLELLLSSTGRLDPKKHLENAIEEIFSTNIVQSLTSLINSVIF